MSTSESPHLFTSESVTEGHPDKIADQVSDAVLDAILARDPTARVAAETLVTTGLVMVAGEITADAEVDIPPVARSVVERIGYDDSRLGFDHETCAVLTSIDKQSEDIARGVDRGGAGDQGMMFGYATDETETLMPVPIALAHALTRRLAEVRREGVLPWVRPDGKAQVTVEYHDGRPVRVDTVVVSTQHAPDVSLDEVQEGVVGQVIEPTLSGDLYRPGEVELHINPTGRFVKGGPQGDAGMTGRKIIVDTYGGVGSHGGGAFSGKDPSKVDRSASYAARWIAKNLVAAEMADRVEIQVAYAIGVPEPVSVMVNSYGTGVAPDPELERAVRDVFDLEPDAVIDALDLQRPIYARAAAYGHFGRAPDGDGGFTWERTDRTEELKTAL